MNKTTIVNFTHICTVIQNNNKLEYKEIPITDNHSHLKESLEKKIDDSKIDLLGLQDYFTSQFPKTTNTITYDYCYPSPYNSSFSASIKKYPIPKTREEYTNLIQNYTKQLQDEYEENKKKGYYIENDIPQCIDFYKTELKRTYVQQCTNYLSAINYYKCINQIQKNRSIKVYSTELIGWKEFPFIINENIKFYIQTNYGYGNSSYFHLILQYKGINILPFSYTIDYFYAKMEDIIRYTKDYTPERENWIDALHFITDTANIAIADESKFINTWIINEVKKMLEGIEEIASDPTSKYQQLSEKKETYNLSFIRNINSDEKSTYTIFPNESILTFQVEKVSGALLFLENLKKLKPIYAEVTNVIKRITQLNKNLIPIITTKIKQIESDNLISQSHIKSLQQKINYLKSLCTEDEQAINKIYEKSKTNTIYDYNLKRIIINNYQKEHPEYAQRCNDIKETNIIISKESLYITSRNNFISSLKRCNERINKYINIQ